MLCCGSKVGTIIFPFVFEAYYFSRQARAVFYLLLLVYTFMGVAIVADTFMCAIEEITSKTRKIKVSTENGELEEIEVKVWNDTIANLTLMALGSSAPEIIISVIDIIVSNFEAGGLGPGTIVGSAAFNLFIIISLCIYAIPEGETRRIKRLGVYSTTAFFSIFAYGWIYFIVKGGHSPDTIELWEAVTTLLFFPLLVSIAFLMDKKILLKPFNHCRKLIGCSPVKNQKNEDNSSELLGFNQLQNSANFTQQQIIDLIKTMKENVSIEVEENLLNFSKPNFLEFGNNRRGDSLNDGFKN